MLSVVQMQEHLNRLSYKPGWIMRVYTGRYEGPHFALEATVPDSVNLGKPLAIRIDSQLPPMPSIDAFERWLMWRLQIVESHELREWFKRDGKPVSDPHGPDAQHDL